MPSLDVHSSQVPNLTFDTLFNAVNKEGTKYDDKSLRLHKAPDGNQGGGEQLQLKVHTGISRLGHGAARDLKRQEALGLVKTAIKNQFNGDQAALDRIMAKVTLSSGDRVSLGELKQLKQAVDQELLQRQDFETLLGNTLEGNTNTPQMLEALDRFQGVFRNQKGARDTAETLKLMDSPIAQDLLNKGLNGTDQEQQDVVDRLALALASLKNNTWVDWQGNANRETTAKSVRGGVTGVLENIQRQVLTNQFNRQHAGEVTQKKQEWTQLMTTQQAKVISQETQQEFNAKGVDELLQDPNWSIARSGGSGSIFVGDPNSTDRSVLKIVEEVHVRASHETSNYILSVAGKLPHNEVSFETMMVNQQDVHGTSQQLSAKLQQMHDDADPNDTRTTGMTQMHLRTLAGLNNPQPNQPVDGMMKCSVIPNATDLNRLPVTDRVGLCKTDTLPKDLGRAMVFGRVFGLDDHVNISSVDGNFSSRNTNLSNLMMNKDTGKLVFIDFQLVDRGRNNGKSGYSEQQVTMAFDALSDFIRNEMNAGNIDETIERILWDVPTENIRSPISSLMHTAFGVGDDSMFRENEIGALGSLTPQDRTRFAINILLGAIEAFKTIANNPEAFTSGQPMFDNPQGVINHVTQLGQGLDQMETELRNYLQTH